MTIRSEIRPSQVNSLTEKVQKRAYRQYLYALTLVKVRGFKDQTVTFEFPVTAIVGPNGGGKTTILGAAGCAYKSVKPKRFFAKSGSFDASMQDWQIDYQVVDKGLKPRDLVTRSASFSKLKWYRDAFARDVAVFGVGRTVPANERAELQRCVSGKFTVANDRVDKFSASVVTAVGRILGKDVSAFASVRVDEKGRVTLLSGKSGKTSYSEFHFGAGESSVIRMVMRLELLPEGSLALIEEIENGLHPVAAVRMVEYLVDLAERRNIQSIFSTHSNDALVPLPSRAIWAAIDGTAVQGRLDIESLRVITGQIDTGLAIFTEDEFARSWVMTALRVGKRVALDRVEIHYLGGDGTAVKIHVGHNADPSRRFDSVCIVDGDSEQEIADIPGTFRLPGMMPESHVFDAVVASLEETKGLLAVALRLDFQGQDAVANVINAVKLTNHDPHLLFSQLGEKLGFLSESSVRDAFLYVWAKQRPEEVESIVSFVSTALLASDTSSAGRKPPHADHALQQMAIVETGPTAPRLGVSRRTMTLRAARLDTADPSR